MSFFGAAPQVPLEEWELEEGQYISASLSNLNRRHRMILLLSVGLVTAIELSNRISINVLLPDLQGNVAADSDEVSWVVILYNLGFLCSLALASWMTRVIGARRHLLFSIALYSVGAFGCFLSSHSLDLLLRHASSWASAAARSSFVPSSCQGSCFQERRKSSL